jgi:hypothetical protein
MDSAPQRDVDKFRIYAIAAIASFGSMVFSSSQASVRRSTTPLVMSGGWTAEPAVISLFFYPPLQDFCGKGAVPADNFLQKQRK